MKFSFVLAFGLFLSATHAAPTMYDKTLGGDIQAFYQGQTKPMVFLFNKCIPYINQQNLKATDAAAKYPSGCFFYSNALCTGKPIFKKPLFLEQSKSPIKIPPPSSKTTTATTTVTPAAFICYEIPPYFG